jgi:hypothetical protein
MKQRAYCVFCHNEIVYDFSLTGGQGECSQKPGGHYAHEPLSAQMGRTLVKSFHSNPKRSRKVLRQR